MHIRFDGKFKFLEIVGSYINLPVTPFFDDRFLHNSWVGLAIDTNLFGNFDTIRFGHKSANYRK